MQRQIADSGDLDFFLLAGPYHLLDTRALDTILPLCEDRGMGCFGGPPFATGVLATGPVPGSTYMYHLRNLSMATEILD
jgi:D-threo-aldose 1-dehydrogenase|eukprot:SAG25_NODE_1013_length_4299_cov_1.754286_3_plen_79_part_00